MLPDDAIKEFIALYFKVFNEQLSWDSAVDKANRLFRMVKVVSILPKNEEKGAKI